MLTFNQRQPENSVARLLDVVSASATIDEFRVAQVSGQWRASVSVRRFYII